MPATANLQDRVTVITGGAGGLGEAIGSVLGAEGAKVVLADVSAEKARATAERLSAKGFCVEGEELDVRDECAVERLLQLVRDRHGSLDILINNAGVDVTAPVQELSVAEWDNILDVNLRAPFVASKATFPLMEQAGGGSIVNIISTAARRAWANASAYHASKWGLLGLSHALHVEGRACGIKVTAVIAGGMRTPFLLDRFPDIDPTVLQDPQNVAETVRFVLSQPGETVIPEVMVLPVNEGSWP